MANEQRRLNVSELDFDQIKENLITFLKDQDVLADYNYDGSAINTIIDLFSYVTHYNAFNANVALNETFLDSAQLRQSVVSHAKLLGYTPRSAYAPRAFVDVQLNNPTGVLNIDGSYRNLTMERGTHFTTLIEGTTYDFVNTTTIVTGRNAAGKYVFENVELLQGKYQTSKYIFDVATDEKFKIPYENAVTSSLIVTVFESPTSNESETFVAAPILTSIDSDTAVYWLQEAQDGFYEIYFGDGIIGKKLTDGNLIQIEYIVTDIDAANGASTFTLSDTIEGNSDATITTITRASGGSAREDLASVKFNAPLSFVAQNRAVTPDDYKSIILSNYANVDAISVWGGEDNNPPDYGKVYISIAPKDSETLPQVEKDYIIAQYLKPKNVVSITPTIVDPTYTYIFLEVFFKYNPNITNLSSDALANKVRETITLYNNDELKRFDGVFRHSNLLRQIDITDVSIINSTVRVYVQKRLVPEVNVEKRYDIYFSGPLYISDSNEQIIESTEFTYLNQLCHLKDIVVGGVRRLQIVSGNGTNEIILNSDVGYVDEANGHVALVGFNPSSFVGDYMTITASPNSNDIAPKRNELLIILSDDTEITGEVDTMVTGGTSAGVNYTTTPRHG